MEFLYESEISDILNFILIAIFSYLLYLSFPLAPSHPDACRQFLMVKDCLENSNCYLKGEMTSVGFFQGALYIHYLVMMRWLGFDPDTIHRFIFIFQAISASLFYILGKKLFNRITGLLSAFLFIATFHTIFETKESWTTSALTPLPLVVFYFALFVFVSNRKTLFALISVFSLSLCTNCHIVCTILIPVFFLTIIAYGSRIIRDIVLTILMFVISNLLLSVQSFDFNLRKLLNHDIM